MTRQIGRAARGLFALIFNRFWWKLLSLAVAAIIWATVASEPELSTFANTQVEYKNLPSDLELASNPVTTVLLELRGPSGELLGLGGESVHPQIILDFSSATPGAHTYGIADGVVRLPRGVHFVSAIPSQVHFNFEVRADTTVPVQPAFSGEGVNGYVVASSTVNPESVRIVGPASHISATREALTDPVDVANAVGTASYRVTAFVVDPYVRIDGPTKVSVTVTMKKKDAGQSPAGGRSPARPH